MIALQFMKLNMYKLDCILSVSTTVQLLYCMNCFDENEECTSSVLVAVKSSSICIFNVH